MHKVTITITGPKHLGKTILSRHLAAILGGCGHSVKVNDDGIIIPDSDIQLTQTDPLSRRFPKEIEIHVGESLPPRHMKDDDQPDDSDDS